MPQAHQLSLNDLPSPQSTTLTLDSLPAPSYESPAEAIAAGASPEEIQHQTQTQASNQVAKIPMHQNIFGKQYLSPADEKRIASYERMGEENELAKGAPVGAAGLITLGSGGEAARLLPELPGILNSVVAGGVGGGAQAGTGTVAHQSLNRKNPFAINSLKQTGEDAAIGAGTGAVGGALFHGVGKLIKAGQTIGGTPKEELEQIFRDRLDSLGPKDVNYDPKENVAAKLGVYTKPDAPPQEIEKPSFFKRGMTVQRHTVFHTPYEPETTEIAHADYTPIKIVPQTPRGPSIPRKLILSPEEVQSAEQLNSLAEQRAHDLGMMHAGGMKPAGGKSTIRIGETEPATRANKLIKGTVKNTPLYGEDGRPLNAYEKKILGHFIEKPLVLSQGSPYLQTVQHTPSIAGKALSKIASGGAYTGGGVGIYELAKRLGLLGGHK